MKIAIVASKFPPIIGGGETYVYLLAKHLTEREHKVEVLTSAFKGMKLSPEKKFPFQVDYVDGFEDFCVGKSGLPIFANAFIFRKFSKRLQPL